MTTHHTDIKKLHIQDTARFALESIPNIHRKTLELLLELINADGTHGTISQKRLLAKMRQILKYIPDACAYSLTVLGDLLEISTAETLALIDTPNDDLVMPTQITDNFFQPVSRHTLRTK